MPARSVDAYFSALGVPALLEHVRRSGGDADALRQRFRLPEDPQAQTEVRFTFSRIRQFWDAVAEEVGDEWAGLHVALQLRRGAYGLLEFSARCAPNLEGALQRVVQYAPLINELAVSTLERQASLAQLELRIPGETLMFGRHGNVYMMTAIISIGRQIVARRWNPTTIWFANPRPPGLQLDELAEALGTTDITFGAGANGMSLRAELLELPVVTADADLLPLLDRQARLSIAGRPTPDDFLGRVRRQLTESLREGRPTLVHVAKRLHMSERTLQRRLLDEGMSFQELLDHTRRTLARGYLEDPRLSLAEVSHRLGYAELRAFVRAFKRWTGTTPGKTRGSDAGSDASGG
jgi:AraC-like DNA-binding protein